MKIQNFKTLKLLKLLKLVFLKVKYKRLLACGHTCSWGRGGGEGKDPPTLVKNKKILLKIKRPPRQNGTDRWKRQRDCATMKLW
jgi:hypothetical protein